MASAYLTKTFSSSGTSDKITTISFWCKRATTSTENSIITANATARDFIRFESSGAFKVYLSGGSANLQTSKLFRDTSAWYHIVVAFDTTQATSSNRIKIYVNGTQISSFSTSTYPAQNTTLKIGTANPNHIGNDSEQTTPYFDGLMTHFHLIDGTAYQASDFGETDSTSGIWKPKTAPSVTYGTNGFFLKFENSGAMGTDSSGNGNNFTVSGTLTQSVDTPSNNFATGNPLYFTNSAWTTSLSNGNLTVTGHSGTNSYPVLASTLAVSAGKFYAEFKVTSSSQNFYCGVATPEAVSGTSINAHYPNWNNEGGSNAHAYSIYGADGLKYVKENGGSTASSSYAGTTSQNDIIGIALDLDNNKLYFHKNGTYFNSGVPTSGSTGTGAISIINHDYLFFFSDGGGSTDASGQANFGSGYFGTTAVASAGSAPSEGGIFEYDCPSGYQALCTKAINSF